MLSKDVFCVGIQNKALASSEGSVEKSERDIWGGTGFLRLSNELPLGHKQAETCRLGWVFESGPGWVGCLKEKLAAFMWGAVEMLLNRT